MKKKDVPYLNMQYGVLTRESSEGNNVNHLHPEQKIDNMNKLFDY